MDISDRRREIENRRRIEREDLLREHNEKFSKEMAELKKDCAKEGHVRGMFWDNGLGYRWYYCCKCGGRMDEQRYGGM